MTESKTGSGRIRKLAPSEADAFRDHLLRLDMRSRRQRFAHAVSDSFIAGYAGRMSELGGITYAYVEEGNVRAAAELKKLGETWGRAAEAAFSVETSYQDLGIGSDLMGRIIRSARNRGVQHLYMSCLAENAKMQAIASKYDALLTFEQGDAVGEIVPDGPNYFSIVAEAVEDRMDYMMAVFDIQRRALEAA